MLPAIDGYLNQKIRRSFFYFVPVIFIMPLAALAVLLNAPNSWAFTIFIIYVFLCYLICFYFIFKSSIHSANLDNVILLIPCAFGLVMMYNQLVARFNGEAASVGAGISIANGLLLTIAFRLLRRSIAAVRAVDSTNVRIAEELRLAEIRINEALTEQHRREQRILLQTEREQLMRELHDGVGNHLISAMAMCRMGSGSLQQVDQMLHETMSELRLALTAMNGYEGELAEGIASFLPQLRRQIRPFNIVLECDVADLPPTPWMRPIHLQHVLRLLQEAVMNAAKHSGSSLVRIDGRADHPCLTVRDYGRGGAEPRDGSYGFQIMQRRADDLGARLEVTSGSDGTIVTLCLLPANHGDCAGVSDQGA
jgi:signal transduction histidine kinase